MNPLGKLDEDRRQAREKQDPWAELCIVSTVTPGGEPSARVLVVRELDPDTRRAPASKLESPALGIFVNASSPKVGEFSNSTSIAVLIYLPSVMVQYRLRCTLDPIEPAVVREAWQMRPEIPKHMDWVYETHPQSSEIASREALIDAVGSQSRDQPLIAPDSALGYVFQPLEIERLDLSGGDAPHDRRRYAAKNGEWLEAVLVP
ncbi:MAG: hypothetical protein OXH52_11915 [Gammaproteobacteria bacterium]|nr:hypothetical protein [Gammaproteobacteria bacterium]